MSIELAVALGVIATRTAVAELIRGTPLDTDGWATVAADVVDAFITTSARQESNAAVLGRQIDQLGGQIGQLGRVLRNEPIREFEEHMAAGRRYVRDLADSWRSERDRRELIGDARREFVRAFGIAEHMNDPLRQAVADVAIAGCWLWIPSLPDVLKTMAAARKVLEQEILYGAILPTASYADVITLCKSYGERSRNAGAPIIPSPGSAPTPGARLAVRTKNNRWVECAGIELFLHGTPAPTGGTVKIKVRNSRAERVSLYVGADAVIIGFPHNGRVPPLNQLTPGAVETLTLNRPSNSPSSWALQSLPAIGFVMPPRPRTR